MSTIPVYDAQGKAVGEESLPPALAAKPHTAVLHEAVVWQLAGRRRGTHATRTRGMVARSTRKLYRQKGTGRARHGGRGAPIFVGGGVVFGPQPRSYGYRLPKQVRRLALRSALSAKAAAGQLAVLDRLELAAPRTRTLAGLLEALHPSRLLRRGNLPGTPELGGDRAAQKAGGLLLIIAAPDPAVERSAANLSSLRVLAAGALNVHDILASQRVLVTREALQRITEALAR